MLKRFVLIVAVCFMATAAQAESVKIGDVLNKLPVKEGYFYDLKDGKGYNVLGLELWAGSGSIQGFSVNAAYVGMEGAGVTLDYDLSGLSIENVPILKYAEYLNVGYGTAIQQITLKDFDENPSADNRLIHGPVLYVKLKF